MKVIRFRFVLLFFALFQIAPTQSGAAGGTGYLGGGGDGGCCGSDGGDVPKELEMDAKALETQFLSVDQKTLRRQRFVKSLCSEYNCGELDEDQASQLLDDLIKEDEKNDGWWFNIAAAFSGIAGVILGALGLILAWFAHKQSTAAERQSARNEVEISHLKDRPVGG